jgi:Cu2+-containing amine oxidase
MRPHVPHLVVVLILGVFVFVGSTQTVQAQCSAPYLIDQTFPTAGPMETRWRLCWQPMSGNGLVITAAFFQKSPTSPLVRVFWDARVSEIFVPYHSGHPRYLDVGYGFPLINLNSKDCPAAKGGTILGPKQEVCKELRDRGIAWKDDTSVRRGEEVTLWGAIDAANYNYIIEWSFRDDGAILGRVGATAQNLPGIPFEAHMHGPIWRLDIDLNGFPGDSVHLGRHIEPVTGLSATDTMTLITAESGQQWNPLEFTSLHIQDSTLKNSRGHSSAYHLMPVRTGTPRHFENFARNDFWVTRYNPTEMAAASLPTYVSTPAGVSNTDIVAWYYGGAHHLVRDEDGEVVNGIWQGEAHVMWTGFMLKPHNLFDKTPLYP